MIRFRDILLCIAALLFGSCGSKELLPIEADNQVIVQRINNNVIGMRKLLIASFSHSLASSFYINLTYDRKPVFHITLKEEGEVVLFNDIPLDSKSAPIVSIGLDQGAYYWLTNGGWLLDSSGNRIDVFSDIVPSFSFSNGIWYYSSGDVVQALREESYYSRGALFQSRYDDSSKTLFFKLLSGLELGIVGDDDNWIVKKNVKNESYYKDIFMDAGLGLTPRKVLYAANYLGLSLDYLCLPSSKGTDEEQTIQNRMIGGDEIDYNGILLYPDGQPRYKLLFVNGGNSRVHGESLSENALNNMRIYVHNGGSYVGTCAGAFFASMGYDSYIDYPYYLSLWPSVTMHTGLFDVRTGMFLEDNSPLLNYYNFGSDKYVEDIRHNGGGYPLDLPANTEVLARYDYPQSDVHLKPSIWAYKQDIKSGRVILEGSHPEEVKDGERLGLTAAMLSYAIEGRGIVIPKGFLHNGETRVMDKYSFSLLPQYSRIGDLQCHHFMVYIPTDASNIKITTTSESNCRLRLLVNQETFAFESNATYISKGGWGSQTLSFPHLMEGIWYVTVQCMSVPSTRQESYGHDYVDSIGVLNGVPYAISVTWDSIDNHNEQV